MIEGFGRYPSKRQLRGAVQHRVIETIDLNALETCDYTEPLVQIFKVMLDAALKFVHYRSGGEASAFVTCMAGSAQVRNRRIALASFRG